MHEEPTAAEIVQAGVARGQLDKECVPIDQRELDEAEEQLIQQFVRDGCKCDHGPNHSPCCTSISADHFRSVRCQMTELTHDELDLVVMGQVMARMLLCGDVPWAGERQVLHRVPSQRPKNLPEDVPLPPHDRLLALQSPQS